MTTMLPAVRTALTSLLDFLERENYSFITPTPLTCARIHARDKAEVPSRLLRDIFGWSKHFPEDALPADLFSLLSHAGIIHPVSDGYRSDIRVSRIDDALFVHSAFPTQSEDAVFLGPDTYRFIRFIRENLPTLPTTRTLRILDVGCGSGAGGIMAARELADVALTLTDINPLALAYSAANAQQAGIAADFCLGDTFHSVEGTFDLILSNPPYLNDPLERSYRHGGGSHGESLSIRIATEGILRLASGGCLLLYTGVAIMDGHDPFQDAMAGLVEKYGLEWQYSEIDVDVFGEELERVEYRDVDRIAAVGMVIKRP